MGNHIHYNYVNNANGRHYECWIEQGPYQFCLYGPLLFYFVFSIMVVLYCLFVRFCSNRKDNTQLVQLQSDLTKRLVLFTFVFIVSWSGAVTDRILGLRNIDKTSPIYIEYWHDIGVASLGLTDAIVWGTSGLWKLDLFEKHLRSMSEAMEKNINSPLGSRYHKIKHDCDREDTLTSAPITQQSHSVSIHHPFAESLASCSQ